MTNTAKETFNEIRAAVEYDFSKPNLGVDMSAASKIIEKTSFTDLPEISKCAAEVSTDENKYCALKPGMTKEELNEWRDKYNKLNIAIGKLPIMVDEELARRQQPIGRQAR